MYDAYGEKSDGFMLDLSSLGSSKNSTYCNGLVILSVSDTMNFDEVDPLNELVQRAAKVEELLKTRMEVINRMPSEAARNVAIKRLEEEMNSLFD